MVEFTSSQTGFELVFKGLHAVESEVMKVLLAQLVPHMLDGVQFGTYGGSANKYTFAGGFRL